MSVLFYIYKQFPADFEESADSSCLIVGKIKCLCGMPGLLYKQLPVALHLSGGNHGLKQAQSDNMARARGRRLLPSLRFFLKPVKAMPGCVAQSDG